MKKILTIIGLAAATLAGVDAQLYSYDFGTGTGTFSTASTISTTFLPQPSTGGGNDMVRVGTGAGSWALANPGVATLGTGSELVGVAPTNTSVNKFAISDFTTATSQFSMSFSMQLSGGSSGTWHMFAGDGATFSDASTFNGAQTFMGIQWVFGTSGTITTNNRAAGAWAAVSGTPFAQSTVYNVEIYGNNTSGILNYTRGTSQSTSANTYDLWVNGTLVGDNLAKAQLATDSVIDSFMFYGVSSTGNVATIALDNFAYGTSITAVPEPKTWALIGIGTSFMLWNLRRRRRFNV